jgi:hypothetical protein
VPALDALAPRLHAAHTLACGVSIDSVYSNAAWAAALGGVSIPLLSDFHPKGAVASSMGCYLDQAGITDRATVLIDAQGVVRFTESVTPGGKRDIEALVARCEALDAEAATLPAFTPKGALPEGVSLYVRDHCMFSRWALYTRENLHLDMPVYNVSTDPARKAELEAVGGKSQAPAMRVGDTVMYESAEIAAFLVKHCGQL